MNRQRFSPEGINFGCSPLLAYSVPPPNVAPIAAMIAKWIKTLRRSLILLPVAWSVGTEDTCADEIRLPSQKQAAVDFSLAGVKIGMSQKVVKKVLRRLEIESASPISSPTVTELESTDIPGFVQFQVFIFQDQVCAISVIYDAHTTKEMGGSDAILAQLKTNLGVPEVTSGESATWIFPKEHRVFKFIGGSEPFFTLKDPALFPELKKGRYSRAQQ